MTREQVLRLATQCGDDVTHTLPEDLAFLERFAEAVAAEEREACARTCEELMKWYETALAIETEISAELYNDGFRTGEATGSEACAEAIRARGEM